MELVANRIAMARALAADVIIMHTGTAPEGQDQAFWQQLRRSLDALQPAARERGVRIAIENGTWPLIRAILAVYPPDYVGVCYDSGHGNLGWGSLDELAADKDRLISVHLHDNDGSADQHKLPFTGTVPWPRLAGIIAHSAYAKCVNLETVMRNTGTQDEAAFLAQAFEAGVRLSRMIDEQRLMQTAQSA